MRSKRAMRFVESLPRLLGASPGSFLLIPLLLPLIGCAPDPYNLYPSAYRVELAVSGPSTLEHAVTEHDRNLYVIMEGVPHPEGGIVYRPLNIPEVDMTPALGGAILGRKARFGEVFDLLRSGFAGEGNDGYLKPRVSAAELGSRAQSLIHAENRDREVILTEIMEGRNVPPAERGIVEALFGYLHYAMSPPGIWIQNDRGEWVTSRGWRSDRYAATAATVEPAPPDESRGPAAEELEGLKPGEDAEAGDDDSGAGGETLGETTESSPAESPPADLPAPNPRLR